MKKATLNRVKDDGNETLGTLTVVQDNGQLFVCKTLERPWKDNQHDISCIPTGSYTCVYNQSEHFSEQKGRPIFTYEVTDVPNRDGIRIHSANYYTELLGCIALGDNFQDINGDDELDVINSVATIAAFEHLMGQQPFTLVIVNGFLV